MTAPKNVSNIDEVDAALKDLAEGHHPMIAKWITVIAKKELLTDVACFKPLSIANVIKAYKTYPWMLKAIPKGTTVYEFDEDDYDFQRFKEDLEHAIAFLESERVGGHKNVQAVPWTTAVVGGVKALAQQKVDEKFKEGPEDKKVLHAYSNGFAWYDLKTERALTNESIHMGHCVGNFGSYYRDLQSGAHRIISLRDKNDLPHATIQLVALDHGLNQLKGKANHGVIDKYKGACVGLIKGMIKKGQIRRVNTFDLASSKISAKDLDCGIDESGNIFEL